MSNKDKATVEELWANVADTLAEAAEAIRAVIEFKAWEPLSCEDFGEAWTNELGNYLTPLVKLSPDEVYGLVKGAMDDPGDTFDNLLTAGGWAT
jgi:hypothetical protein